MPRSKKAKPVAPDQWNFHFMGYWSEAAPRTLEAMGITEQLIPAGHVRRFIVEGPDMHGRNPFVARITGLGSPYKYQRQFVGRLMGSSGAPRLHWPVAVMTGAEIYQIRGISEPGWFCVYPDAENRPQLAEITEYTMKALLMAKIDPFKASAKPQTANSINNWVQNLASQMSGSAPVLVTHDRPMTPPTPAITVAPEAGKRRILKG